MNFRDFSWPKWICASIVSRRIKDNPPYLLKTHLLRRNRGKPCSKKKKFRDSSTERMNGFEVKKGASLCVASVDSDLIYYSDFRVFGVFCGALSDEPNRRIFSPLIHTNFHLYQTPDALHEGRKARRAISHRRIVLRCLGELGVKCKSLR